MDLMIMPSKLKGKINIPDSVPMSHRLMVMVALQGDSIIKMTNITKELETTEKALQSLANYSQVIDVGNSRDTFSFLLPLSLITRGGGLFRGNQYMINSLINPIKPLLLKHGALIFPASSSETLRIGGSLSPGNYTFSSDVYPVIPSGFAMALSILNQDSDVILEKDAVSKNSYAIKENMNLTLSVMREFNTKIIVLENRYHIFGNQNFKAPAPVLSPEKDWNIGSIWYTSAILGQNVKCPNITRNSSQRGHLLVDMVQKLGLQKEGGILKIDAMQLGDTLPFAMVIASTTRNTSTVFYNMDEAHDIGNESKNMILSLGGSIKETDEGIKILGKSYLQGGVIKPNGYANVAMAAAIAATVSGNPVTIENAEVVQDIYPQFFRDYKRLGGSIFPVQ